MDIYVLELFFAFGAFYRLLINLDLGSCMTDERGRIWYGAVAFWIVVAGLMTARVMLLDLDKIHSQNAVSEATSASAAGMLAAPRNGNF
jgi:hypothetical protein